MTSPARIVALATIFVALASMSCSTSIRLLPPAGVTELRARAELGIAGAQFNLGVMYANGRGVLQDYVQAHMWFNLGASRLTGELRETAVQDRDKVAGLMNPTQLAEAQRLVREWDAAHPREPTLH